MMPVDKGKNEVSVRTLEKLCVGCIFWWRKRLKYGKIIGVICSGDNYYLVMFCNDIFFDFNSISYM